MTTALGSVSAKTREIVEKRAKNPVTITTVRFDTDIALGLFAAAIGAAHLRSANDAEAEEAFVRDRIAPALGRGLSPGKLDWIAAEMGETIHGLSRLSVHRGEPTKITFEGKVTGADEKVTVKATLTSTTEGQTLELSGFPEHLVPIAGVHATESIWVFNETSYRLEDALTRASGFAILDRNKQDHG